VLVIVALLLTLLLTTRGGTTTVLLGAASDQAATASSAHATTTAEGTPLPSGTAGTTAPHATATPRQAAPAVHLVSAQGTASTGSSVSVSCPSGELALSGGWKTDASTTIYNSSRAGGSGGNGWRVFPRSPTGASVTVYALCLQHVSGALITERSVQLTPGANAGANNGVRCAIGEVAVGGGYASPAPGVALVELDEYTDFTGVGGSVINSTSSPQTAFIYAECLRATRAHPSLAPTANTVVGGGASGRLQATCPQGMLLVGGSTFPTVNVLYEFFPSSVTTWQAGLKNPGAYGAGATLSAVCVSFN
jgi:hypothetical protein